ncbi:MAG: PQQ-dependent catabolism-associated CXXCW motif protein, partial [Aestuariivirgaceae bacterium]
MLVAVFISGAAHAGAAEPGDYRLKDFRSPVPATLTGADVVSPQRAWQLWRAGETLFIDVMPQAPKPKNLPKGTFWREKTRDNIPGSYWLANVGYGRLHPDADRWFK